MEVDSAFSDRDDLDRLHDPVAYRTRELFANERRTDGRRALESRAVCAQPWTFRQDAAQVPVLHLQRGGTQVLVAAYPSAFWRITVQVPALCNGFGVASEAVMLTEYLERLIYPILPVGRSSEQDPPTREQWCWNVELYVLSSDGCVRDILLLGLKQILPECLRHHRQWQRMADAEPTELPGAQVMTRMDNLVPCSFLILPYRMNRDSTECPVRVVVDPTADEEDTDSTLVTAVFYINRSEPAPGPTVYSLECSGKPVRGDELETCLSQVTAYLRAQYP
jgi:hypothetical protein